MVLNHRSIDLYQVHPDLVKRQYMTDLTLGKLGTGHFRDRSSFRLWLVGPRSRM